MQKRMFYLGLMVFFLTMGFLLTSFVVERRTVAAATPNWWAGSAAQYNELVNNAVKEGELIWYDSLGSKDAEALAEAFNALYPKIKITHTRVRGLASRETILRELQAGVTKIDVLEVSDELIETYRKMKLFMKYSWKDRFKVHPIQLGKTGEMLKIGGTLYVFVYNIDNVSPQEAPKTYEDLLDPKWKGRKIGRDTRPKDFSALWPGWGEEKMVNYLKKLGKQQLLYKRGTTAGVQMTAAGEISVYAASSYDSFTKVKKRGAPIDFIVPKPMTGVSFEREAVVHNAPHPNAAILFLGWLASGGQELYDEVSNGEGIPLPGFNTAAGKLIKSADQLSVFDDDWLPRKAEIRRRCNEALGFTTRR